MSTDLLLPRSPFPRTPFPLHSFPTPMADLIDAASDIFDLDPAAIALPMLTVAGAAIGNSRRLQLTDGHSLPPNIWSAILSNDDPRLSHIHRLILAPLIERQENIADFIHLSQSQYSIELDDWNHFHHETNEPKPLPPRADFRQYFFTDPDYRRLPEYLARQPRGCLLVQDDLSQWFQATPIQCLSLFDAPPFTFDRAKSLHIRFAPHAFLAVTGSLSPTEPDCVSPGLFHRSPDSNSIRLASRFLFACPPQTHSLRPASFIKPRVLLAWSDLITKLYCLDPTPSLGSIKPILLPLHRSAIKELNSAHDHLATAALQQSDPRLRRHLLNLIEYIPRLALILQLATPSDESPHDLVDAYSISSAAKLIEWFADELKRIYLNLAIDSSAAETLSILSLISRHGGKITARELMRASRPFSRSTSDAQTLLQNLAAKGLGQISWDSRYNRRSPTFHLNCHADADTNPAGAVKTSPTVGAPRKKSRR
jgi:hypothetical protein